MLQWYRVSAGFGTHNDPKYFQKDASESFNWQRNVVVEIHGDERPKKGSLYIRTAYRNDPDFNVSSFNREGSSVKSV